MKLLNVNIYLYNFFNKNDNPFFCPQKKTPGGEDTLPDDFQLLSIENQDGLKPLSVEQIKRIRELIDKEMCENEKQLVQAEVERGNALSELGNLLHPSVPISNDEVSYRMKNDELYLS